MKRFQFSLEKVLRLRAQETQQAKRALGQAMAAEAAARQEAEVAHTLLRHRTEEAGVRERAGLVAFELASQRHWLAFLQKQAAAADSALAAASALTLQRRLHLLAARRRERAMEKLKERRLEQYLIEAGRAEQKELDEYGNRQSLNEPPSETDN